MNSADKIRLNRFTPLQRLFHLALILSFMIQAATGLARMYIGTEWGRWLLGLFGGDERALALHCHVGLFMICGFIIHIFYLLAIIGWKNFPGSLAGPDSIIPRSRDAGDFFRHIGWFLWLKKPPAFDRWGYWEKFDYWAVFWGMLILGTTGILMAYPLFFTGFVPGWMLNVAFWIHRIEALLAAAHVFVIHFFIAHLRKRHFPMDFAMFEGSVDIRAVESEKPEWLKRLKEKGRYEKLLVAEARGAPKILYRVFGYATVTVGIFLFVCSVVNIGGITW